MINKILTFFKLLFKDTIYDLSNEDFVFNATNLTFDMRSKWISLFEDYNKHITIIYLEVPYKTLLFQNKNRKHSVPNEEIDRLIKKLEIPTLREAHKIWNFTTT